MAQSVGMLIGSPSLHRGQVTWNVCRSEMWVMPCKDSEGLRITHIGNNRKRRKEAWRDFYGW